MAVQAAFSALLRKKLYLARQERCVAGGLRHILAPPSE